MDNDAIDYGKIPLSTIEALRRYIDHHIPTGGFLRAVLSNDLQLACARADSDNREALYEIVMWLHNHAADVCYGSAEAFAEWTRERK